MDVAAADVERGSPRLRHRAAARTRGGSLRSCCSQPEHPAAVAAATPSLSEAERQTGSSFGSSRSSVVLAKPLPLLAVSALILCLLLGAAVGAAFAFIEGRASELSTFSLRFDGSAQQVNATLQGALELKLCAAMACARQMVHPAATAPFAQHEPAQTAQFAEDVGPLVALSSALLLYQSAVVTSAARPAFEAGAAASAARTNDTALAAQLAFGINDVFPTVLPAGPPHRAPAAEYHLPMLHVSPMTPLLSAFIMYDTRAASNLPERHVALETAVRTGRPAWSDILGSTVLTPAGGFAPSNQVVVPVLSPGAQSGGVNATLGTCTLLFDWSSVLKSVLPGFVTSVTAVLTSFSGRQATFQLRDGVVAIVGLGDLHDARFNAYKRVAVANAGGATWQVALYPTQVLVDSYLTAAPLRNAIIIAVVVSLCCAVFAHYELHVRRRANAMNLLLRRNLEELGRLKAEEQRLMEAGIKQQDQFVSMVSHEIRTPLNAVNGATHLLLDTAPLTQEQLELLQLLEAGANHVVLIVEDILLHGALNSGQFPVVTEPLTLTSSVLEPAWSMISFQQRLRDKLATITFTRVIAPDVPETIMGDSTRLLQVLSNLLSNSSKFTPEGGAITLSVDIQRDAPAGLEATEPPPEAAWLRFRVQDTGIGLAKDKLDSVFMPFTQANQSTVRVYGGTGLGLTICRRIAAAMGGSLVAHSDGLGKGVTMEFVIPLRSGIRRRSSVVVVDMTALRVQACNAAAAPSSCVAPSLSVQTAPESPVSDAASSPASSGGADAAPQHQADCVRVLIAEDDRLCQTLMRKLLPKMGFAATLVDNGASAVEEACRCGPDAACAYDVVLMDLHMPILDGLQAATAIRERLQGRCPPIVALTASTSDEEKQRCVDAGMVAHLSKPIKAQQLGVLHELVAASRRKQALGHADAANAA